MCSPRPLPSQMGNQFVNLFRVQIGLDFAGSCRISNAAALRNGYKNLNKGKHFRPQIETHFQFQNLRKTAHTAPGSTCRYPSPPGSGVSMRWGTTLEQQMERYLFLWKFAIDRGKTAAACTTKHLVLEGIFPSVFSVCKWFRWQHWKHVQSGKRRAGARFNINAYFGRMQISPWFSTVAARSLQFCFESNVSRVCLENKFFLREQFVDLK